MKFIKYYMKYSIQTHLSTKKMFDTVNTTKHKS